MGKCLIPIIMKELGLENDDVFIFEGYRMPLFRFHNNVLQFSKDESGSRNFCAASDETLADICDGLDITIIERAPFNVTIGGVYYSYTDNWDVKKCVWTGSIIDYALKGCGCVFRTFDEALKALPKKHDELVNGKKIKDTEVIDEQV